MENKPTNNEVCGGCAVDSPHGERLRKNWTQETARLAKSPTDESLTRTSRYRLDTFPHFPPSIHPSLVIDLITLIRLLKLGIDIDDEIMPFSICTIITYQEKL